ncbi:MAG: hypothetical protein COA74_02155 [Gammaproteobacteria bacterium]|nr:MAG: hypothetical protein COA74_02155 [Gammaproteobacteria bacterium]
MRSTNYLNCILLLTLYSTGSLIAAEINKPSKENFNLPHFNEQITVDGKVDEAVWKKAAQFELNIETAPGENTKAPVRTTVYMYEDGENLNLAFIAYDPDPSKIVAHYHDHDFIFDDDLVGFKVDTYNDSLRSYQFFANYLGVKHDSIEDGVIGKDDLSWNAIWESAGIKTEQGYQVEFSVPLSILRFNDSLDVQKWGFDLLRFYPRGVRHRISMNKVDRNISCKLCQNPTFTGLRDIKTGNNLTVVPFMTAIQHEQRVNPITDPWTDSGVETDFGFDLRWGVTADTTINASLNPDFSQVESDVAQLDANQTFSLFFPEKRPFFIEGSDYYQSLMNIVYTRNISDPDYGAKVTHSSNSNNYAAFIANDTETNYFLPGHSSSNIASLTTGSNNAVFRYRRDLENTSSIGTLITRREADDYQNTVYGLDGVYRFSDTDLIRAQVLLSDTEDPQAIVDEFGLVSNESKGSALDFFYRHQGRNWAYWGRYTQIDQEFRADLGFLPRVGYKKYLAGVARYWYQESGNWWNEMSLGLVALEEETIDGQSLDSTVYGFFNISGPLQSKFEVNTVSGETYWQGVAYDINDISFDLQLVPLAGINLFFVASAGKNIDFTNSRAADTLRLSPRIKLNLGLHFQTELRYTKLILDVEGGELFNSTLVDARLIYQFSVQSFLRLVVQYSDTERNQSLYLDPVDAKSKNLATQLLYSYKINQQTVFFLGYSDSSFEDDSFNQLQKTDKILFLKMSYSWLY